MTGESTPAGPDLEPLMAASRAITAAIVRSLSSVDESVSVTQLRILVMVGSQGPLTVGAVAEALSVNASNASRSCDRLVGAGLLDRREAEHDRRQVALTLTDAGAELVDSVMKRRRDELGEIVGLMTAADQAALMAGLEAFAAAATRLDHEPPGADHLIAWFA